MAGEGEDDGLRLLVPVRVFSDEFTCPICYDPVTDCRMTKCGHNFCSSCISEWITRSHSCPVCTTETTEAELIPNHFFDALMAKVSAEKEAARKRYFSELAAGGRPPLAHASSTASATDPAAAAPSGLSAVETVFMKHMQRSLGSYKEYLEGLQTAFDARKARVLAAFADAAEAIGGSHAARLRRLQSDDGPGSFDIVRAGDDAPMPAGPPGLSRTESESARDAELAEAKAKRDAQLGELQAEYDSAVESLVSSYDAYLGSAAPDALLLPTAATIKVVSRGVSFSARVLPTHFVRDLVEMLEAHARESADPLVSIEEGGRWGLKSSLIRDGGGGAAVGAGGAGGASPAGDVIWFSEPGKTLYQHTPSGRLPPRCEIVFEGTITLQSDRPMSCFATTFVKGEGQVQDYFTCKNCRINWVCEACAATCHKDHDVRPYIAGHKPSYGCCYCKKKKKCVLVSRK